MARRAAGSRGCAWVLRPPLFPLLKDTPGLSGFPGRNRPSSPSPEPTHRKLPTRKEAGKTPGGRCLWGRCRFWLKTTYLGGPAGGTALRGRRRAHGLTARLRSSRSPRPAQLSSAPPRCTAGSARTGPQAVCAAPRPAGWPRAAGGTESPRRASVGTHRAPTRHAAPGGAGRGGEGGREAGAPGVGGTPALPALQGRELTAQGPAVGGSPSWGPDRCQAAVSHPKPRRVGG